MLCLPTIKMASETMNRCVRRKCFHAKHWLFKNRGMSRSAVIVTMGDITTQRKKKIPLRKTNVCGQTSEVHTKRFVCWSRQFLSEFPVKLRSISSPAQTSTMSSCRRVSRELISSWSRVRKGSRFLSCLSLLRVYFADFFFRISRNTNAGNMPRMACDIMQ